MVTEVEANVLIAPIAISLTTLVIGVISYMGGLPHTAHVAQSSNPQPPQPPSSSTSQGISLTDSEYDDYFRYQATKSALLLLLPRLDLFSSIATTSALPTVTLANGSQTVAKGIGLAHPLPSLPSLLSFILPSVPLIDRSTGKTIGIGRESQGLYHLTLHSTLAVCISTDTPLLIHSCLGHLSLSKFQKMVPRFSSLSSLACESCQLGKHTRVSFPKRLNNRTNLILNLSTLTFGVLVGLHLLYDFSILSLSLMTILNGIFFCTIYFIYVPTWILHQSSCAHTPQQNGVAERDAVLPTCYLINRMPSSVLHDQTPHSLLFPDQPLYFLPPRVFGCTCFVHILTPGQDKLSTKATKCIFLGYSRLQKGYCCYSSETHRYFLSADVTFFEDSPFFSISESLPISEVLPLPIISPPDAVPFRLLQVYHRRHRVPVPPSLAEVPADSFPIPLASPAPTLPPSADLLIALRKGWRQAMVDEMAALHSNGTWDLIVLPFGKSTIGCRWVYTVKVGPDGQVDRLKARLVAKGYTQVYGSDYGNTFSPIAKIASTKDLGKLKYFSGIEIAQSSSGCGSFQRKYALNILEETGMLDCKPVDTPMDPNVKLIPGQGEPLGDPGRYRRLVDADWADSPTDRRSTSGYCVFIEGNLISWKSKKQDVVARSSAEAGIKLWLWQHVNSWLKHLLRELRFGKDEQMKLICDNQAALHIASNPVFHERTKHIEVDCHSIREKIASRCVATSFVNSNDQLADIFTKSLKALRIKEWKETMKVEMDALEKNKTWDFVELPQGKKLVGCKWVFTVKYKADGSLEQHKAKLVAKSSLTSRMPFYMVELDEEIYMEVPPGFESKKNKVHRLKKTFYDLNNLPRTWFDRFARVMKALVTKLE
ncbi:Retrovirus-related Pol polyprotein from transposon TNT 1-94 [Vitis vinifera]|uniref:Retrovirus-related Pol polyprotein from transposon TNT 1-94 n=1 Tax=Vitis vinifera TaxID=29760 RepID=A0A438JKK2_VITVI|nr:Retrovirus-related Pol polyprotein from transposon TNT 1-94 [Vitis vinifera]